MEPVVIARGGRPRYESPGCRRSQPIRFAGGILAPVLMAALLGTAGRSVAQGPPSPVEGRGGQTSPKSGHARQTRSALGPTEPRATTEVASRSSAPPKAPIPAEEAAGPPLMAADRVSAQAERFLLRDPSGECVVARLHGRSGARTALLCPDGQIGFPNRLVRTDEPFRPLTSEQLRERLEEGPYKGYKVLKTAHYVIFYQSKEAFAQDSAKLMEDLYDGLIDACRRNGIPVHESEFPLVAVIFATEKDFRTHKQVDPEVQAYYEIYTNRIFFYEQSERDQTEPRLMALRKPQTVAHEGAHQILGNIGVQPRLSDWPPWLIEGFAEYCATPTLGRKGVAWDRMGTINALHMATLRELDDPLSNEIVARGAAAKPAGRPARLIDVETLVAKQRLTPTDYAQSWALTHYLAQKRYADFLRYLKAMSAMPPLERRTPERHLAEFRKYFGDDLSKVDKKAEEYIRKLSEKGKFIPLPYYAVIFEQPLPGGMIRRGAMISQSPQVIQRWVEQYTAPQGGIPNWEAFPYPTRARAVLAAEEWMRAN
jgi:hypothetical protein